jgi:hypothetical protein
MSDALLADLRGAPIRVTPIIKRTHPVALKFPILGNAILSVTIKDGAVEQQKKSVHMLASAYEPTAIDPWRSHKRKRYFSPQEKLRPALISG